MQDSSSQPLFSSQIPPKSSPKGREEKEPYQIEILRQLQRTFAFLHEGRQSCYDPYRLIMACKPLRLQFAVTSQNDASEFYDQLLDALDEAFKKENNEDGVQFLKDCFAGNQVKLKRCEVCGTITERAEAGHFNRLEVVLKDNLIDCLDEFIKPEEMTGENKVECDYCRTRTNTTFITCLKKLPDYLFVHPKRFTYDLETSQTVKLNNYMSFPLTLDLFKYTKDAVVFPDQNPQQQQSPSQPQSSPALHPTAALRLKTNLPEQSLLYELMGILVHRGKSGGGHYYAFIESEPQKWVQLNDDRVMSFDPSKIPEECFGGRVERTTSNWGYNRTETVDNEKSAFMLLYVKKNLPRAPVTSSSLDSGSMVMAPSVSPFPLTTSDVVMDLNLSDKDMFQEDGWEEDEDMNSEGAGGDSESENGETSNPLALGRSISRQSQTSSQANKSVALSVPKPPPAAFGFTPSTRNKLELAAMEKAKSLTNESFLKNMKVMDTRKRDYEISRQRAALKMEVEKASQTVSRQALLFNSVTQRFVLDALTDTLNQTTVLREHYEFSLLLNPAFRFFFNVVSRSRSLNDDTLNNWIKVLNELVSRCDHPDQFCNDTLFDWIQAPEGNAPYSSEIGLPMNRPVSIGEALLDCGEKKARMALLEGMTVLLKHCSPDILLRLIQALLIRSSKRTNTIARTLESLTLTLRKIFQVRPQDSMQTAIQLNCADTICKGLSQASSPSVELVNECCFIIDEIVKAKSSLEEHEASMAVENPDEYLRNAQLRDVLISVGLSMNNSHFRVVQHVLLHHSQVANSTEFDLLVQSLLNTIRMDCSMTASSSNDHANGVIQLPMDYETSLTMAPPPTANIFGNLEDRRMNLLAQAISMQSQAGMELGLRRMVSMASDAVLDKLVLDLLDHGCHSELLRNPAGWEEKLFPHDMNDLRIACRILACLVLKLATIPECAQYLQTLDSFRALITWFIMASSPFNQQCHEKGFNTPVTRKIREAMARLTTQEEVLRINSMVGSSLSELCFKISNAGEEGVSGLYRYSTQLKRWISSKGVSLYKCALLSGNEEEWFISHVEDGFSVADERNVDFYSSSPISKHVECMVPPASDWKCRRSFQPVPTVTKILERDLDAILEMTNTHHNDDSRGGGSGSANEAFHAYYM